MSDDNHEEADEESTLQSPPGAMAIAFEPRVAAQGRRRFEGRTVIVTGGSRGLGRAMAVAFAAEGAHVVIGYLARDKDAEQSLAMVRAAGGDGTTMAFDVASRPAVDAAIDQVIRDRGRIDVLVNNAGIARDELFPLMDQQSWDDVIATNLGGLFHCARAVVRPMLSAGGGAIVNVGAVSALRASPGQVNYAASKGGLLAFTRALGAELASRGVRVNAVIPGAIASGLAARMDRRIAERIRTGIPLGRFGTADEVARAVLFLASDDAAYIVGHALVVDGGLSA
jgi:3-oxoacyl-[acyl-carrier protein] reductase